MDYLSYSDSKRRTLEDEPISYFKLVPKKTRVILVIINKNRKRTMKNTNSR